MAIAPSRVRICRKTCIYLCKKYSYKFTEKSLLFTRQPGHPEKDGDGSVGAVDPVGAALVALRAAKIESSRNLSVGNILNHSQIVHKSLGFGEGELVTGGLIEIEIGVGHIAGTVVHRNLIAVLFVHARGCDRTDTILVREAFQWTN